MAGGSRHSIFSQRFDRAVLASYFLGGLVPIGALVWVVQEFVLPHYEPTSFSYLGWIAGLACLGFLSLAVYLALRRITGTTVARMQHDNRRLATLLAASRELGTAREPDRILVSASARAREVSGSPHAVFLLSPDADKPFELRHADAESRRWFEANAAALADLAVEVSSEGHGAASRGAGGNARVAVPVRFSQHARGALLVEGSPAQLGPEAMDALTTIAGMAGTALQRGDLEDAQRNFFAHVTELIVTALDGHVVGRRDHASNVARFANRIAHEIQLDAPRKERLHFAAMLHDIGMLKIEPARHLDPKAVRPHPMLGARMLSRIRVWEPLAPIVLHHHERWDGSGYPEGLAGDAIPLEARIIAVADSVDAMNRAEGHRLARSPQEIAKEVERCRGTQFDPAIADAFLALHARDESGL
jgi:putative nucleotidyltransferase with HDIG domain